MILRKAMIESVSEMIRNEENTSLFLVDIGVYGFRNLIKEYPKRVLNIGIFEDGMVSLAAGLALRGIIPTIYAISPFIINRSFEQLKLDFAYQELQGNFITTGASHDFSKLGYSHYCPEDLAVIQQIPGFEFIAPGSPTEFSTLFAQTHSNGKPTYFRCSDYVNKDSEKVQFAKANIIKEGSKATVIAVSTTLDIVKEACKDEDVTILYYTTLIPFDYETLSKYYNNGRILLCEPHYEGSLALEVIKSFKGKAIHLETVGIKKEIMRNYGSKIENDIYNGITIENINLKLSKLIE